MSSAGRRPHPVLWWRLALLPVAGAFSLLLILQPTPWRVLAEVGAKQNLTETVFIWTWWGGLAAMAVVAGLLLLCPWWARAPRPAPADAASPPAPRWFWPLVLGAVIACTAITAPTMNHGLWDDENETLASYVLGRYDRKAEADKPRFKEHAWRKTLFGYSTPNNHVFHNILARSSNDLWRAVFRPRGLEFHHWAVRLPAFLAALGAIAALAWLLKEFGFPAAGTIAAWLLALHPWFTEHASLARGYTLVMLLSLLAVMAWRRALLTGAWLWWALFAGAQFLLLWTYPGALFLLALLNAAVLVLLRFRPAAVAGPPRTVLARWFCCNSLVAAGLFPLLLPLFAQIRGYIDRLGDELIGWGWINDTGWFFLGGAPWMRASGTEWKYLDMQLVRHELGTGAVWFLFVFGAGFLLAGLWRFARSGSLAGALTVCALVAPILQFLYARHQCIHIWEWYVIFALPFVTMFWGVGLQQCGLLLGRVLRAPWLAPAVVTVLVGLFAWATGPVRAWQAEYPRTPHLAATVLTRPDHDNYRSKENRHLITFSFTNPSYAYDPNLLVVRTPVELVLLCRMADRLERPLAGNFGHPPVLEADHPAMHALLHDRRLFGVHRRIGGADRIWDRDVYFYTPGSVAEFDFSSILTAEESAFIERYAALSPETFFAPKIRPVPVGANSAGDQQTGESD